MDKTDKTKLLRLANFLETVRPHTGDFAVNNQVELLEQAATQLLSMYHRMRIVAVIAMVVATFALMTAIGAEHSAKQARDRAEAASRTLEAAERRMASHRELLMYQIEAFLKSLDRTQAPRPRQAKKV